MMNDIIVFAILITLLGGGWAFSYFRKRREFGTMLDMVFLRVILPRKDSDSDEKRETSRDFKEQVSLMEQLLMALRSLLDAGFMARFF